MSDPTEKALTELGWLIQRAMESKSAKEDAIEYLAEIEGALKAADDTVEDLQGILNEERSVLHRFKDALGRIAHLDETEGAGDVSAAMTIARTALLFYALPRRGHTTHGGVGRWAPEDGCMHEQGDGIACAAAFHGMRPEDVIIPCLCDCHEEEQSDG